MADGTSEELWIPLVDEPIGSIVSKIQEDDAEITRLVATSLPEDVLRRLFGAFLLLTALHLVWRTRRS